MYRHTFCVLCSSDLISKVGFSIILRLYKKNSILLFYCVNTIKFMDLRMAFTLAF